MNKLFSEQLQHLESEQPADDNSNSEASRRRKRQASLLYPKWKDNTLYYYIDSSISEFVIMVDRN